MKEKACNPQYKLEFILVNHTEVTLKDVQKKINTWISTGVLKKYKTSAIGSNILFEIVKLKG